MPFLVPREAETNVELCDFIVPKNAQMLINVWAMRLKHMAKPKFIYAQNVFSARY